MPDHHRDHPFPHSWGVLIPTRAESLPRHDRPDEIREWLASAHYDPMTPGREWAEDLGVAMLPLGPVMCAVRIPARMVHAVAGTDEAETVADCLTQALRGPVIYDPLTARQGYPYYALVPYRFLAEPFPAGTMYLGKGVWLGVPDLTRTGPRGVHWAVLPRFRNDLCSLDLVHGFILHAAAKAGDQ
ncbi:hypothetical protein ABZX85_23485 [Streptomyces sp. NPDC004539]|uniref:hypothetical protein n=1 Tax=Streptomyces sp. NPDC004539 TaxID=3154280 RepID=UPI0033B0B6FA